MTFKYLYIALIISLFLPMHSIGQAVNDYRLQYGFSFGYRSFNLDEANERVNFMNEGKLKPDHGSAAFSADIKGRPFKGNNFFLSFRFDYLPEDTRHYFGRVNDPPHVITNQKSGQSDTSYSYIDISSTTETKICFASMQAGYDISFDKYMVSLECGAIYGSFFINQIQNQQAFYKFDQSLYYSGKYISDRYTFRTKNNLGFTASGLLSYPLLSRLNTNFLFSVIFLNPEITLNNGTLWVSDGYFGVRGFGFFYPRVLTAQLSGVQCSLGLTYTLF